jgi:hypothetical protein
MPVPAQVMHSSTWRRVEPSSLPLLFDATEVLHKLFANVVIRRMERWRQRKIPGSLLFQNETSYFLLCVADVAASGDGSFPTRRHRLIEALYAQSESLLMKIFPCWKILLREREHY